MRPSDRRCGHARGLLTAAKMPPGSGPGRGNLLQEGGRGDFLVHVEVRD